MIDDQPDKLYESRSNADFVRPSKMIIAAEVTVLMLDNIKWVVIGGLFYLALRAIA